MGAAIVSKWTGRRGETGRFGGYEALRGGAGATLAQVPVAAVSWRRRHPVCPAPLEIP